MVATAALGVFLWVSVLLIGSAHWNVAAGMASAGCALLLLLNNRCRADWNGFSYICFGLALWSLFSIVPLPQFAVELLAPSSIALRLETAGALGSPLPRFMPLSLDPVATLLEVSKWASYGCLATLGSHVARTRGLGFVLGLLWGAAVLVAVVTLFQSLTKIPNVLGIYQPLRESPHRTATLFINENNLACFANLGTLCGLGLVGSRRQLFPPVVVYSGIALCIATTILSGSRAGVAMLALGLLLLFLTQYVSTKQPNRGSLTYPLLAVVLLGLGLAFLGGTSSLWGDLFAKDLSKLQTIFELRGAIKDNWAVGVGRGAFETVAFLYLDGGNNVVLRSVENFVASWVIEWGIPAAMAACLSLGWLLRPARLRVARSRSATAALVAVYVLIGQSLFDLSLELLSISASGFILCGALEGTRDERTTSRVPSKKLSAPLLPRVMAILGAVAGITAILLGPDVYSMRRVLADRAASLNLNDKDGYLRFMDELRQEMLRRPAEPYFPLIAAATSLRYNKDALGWAAQALRRAPRVGRANLAVAEALLQRNAVTQAMLHFRRAILGEPALITEAASRAVAVTQKISDFKTAAPEGALGAQFLLTARGLVKENSVLQSELLASAAQLSPGSQMVISALAFDELARLKTAHSCVGGPCRGNLSSAERESILTLARKLEGSPTCDHVRLRGRLRDLEGNSDQAVELMSSCSQCSRPTICAQERATLAQKAKNPALRREAESAYISLACDSPSTCAGAELWVAQRAQSRQDWLSAYTYYARAAGRTPTADLWLAAARTAALAGQLAQAEVAYNQAKVLGATSSEIEDQLRKAQRRALGSESD